MSSTTLADILLYRASCGVNVKGVPIANSDLVTTMSEVEPTANNSNIREVPIANYSNI